MDISSISRTAVMMQAAQTQQGISTTLMKMAADQQQQMANMLAQSAQNVSQNAVQNGYNFSIYA
jgi:hypothetical protein